LKKYNNVSQLSLSMAVWLATDLYDYNDNPNTISVTSLIKPLKQLVLSARVPEGSALPDIKDKLKAQSGTAVHTAVEFAWMNHYPSAMKALGYTQELIDKVRVNPENPTEGTIPIYLERRSSKEIEGMTVSGKFDLVVDGRLEDIKQTSTYTYVNNTKEEDYQLQGSIYRWLNQDIITKDEMYIQFVFTDWKAFELKSKPLVYPAKPQLCHTVPLMSIDETEEYISRRIIKLKSLMGKPESELPACTDKELWRGDSVWKYYKDQAKMKRSTKNFLNGVDAYELQAKNGGVGVVIEVKPAAKACLYCSAFPICKQKDAYIADFT